MGYAGGVFGHGAHLSAKSWHTRMVAVLLVASSSCARQSDRVRRRMAKGKAARSRVTALAAGTDLVGAAAHAEILLQQRKQRPAGRGDNFFERCAREGRREGVNGGERPSPASHEPRPITASCAGRQQALSLYWKHCGRRGERGGQARV